MVKTDVLGEKLKVFQLQNLSSRKNNQELLKEQNLKKELERQKKTANGSTNQTKREILPLTWNKIENLKAHELKKFCF